MQKSGHIAISAGFPTWLIFFFFKFSCLWKCGENAVSLMGNLLEAVQNVECCPTEEQPDMPV